MRACGIACSTIRVTVALVVAFTCIMHAKPARAAPFDLEWSAPEGCPSRERMIAATRARLGESEASAPPALFVRGTVAADDGVIVVDLQVKDIAGAELGERRVRFDGSSCQAIVDPTALVLAMMLAVARPHEPEPEPATAPAPTSKPAPDRHNPFASHPSSGPPLTTAKERTHVPMTFGASGVASLGLLPNAGFGGALRWTATLASFVVVGAEGSFETSWAARAASGEATFQFFDAGALAGVRLVRSRYLEIVPLLEARGGGHVCAILQDGSVRCWGSNDSGQLGTSATTRPQSPRTSPCRDGWST
ncbi:MAG: hypothetical protein K0S65_1136, partial [Labilithrix sp.]|nr:hypothetical protein [Labilithrix sp.]